MLRASIAYFWFVTLHPFDDGNGRITRALTDLALAQAEDQTIRCYSLSASILEDRNGYYQILESSQRCNLDLTDWLCWFLATLARSPEQARVPNRVLDGGEEASKALSVQLSIRPSPRSPRLQPPVTWPIGSPRVAW